MKSGEIAVIFSPIFKNGLRIFVPSVESTELDAKIRHPWGCALNKLSMAIISLLLKDSTEDIQVMKNLNLHEFPWKKSFTLLEKLLICASDPIILIRDLFFRLLLCRAAMEAFLKATKFRFFREMWKWVFGFETGTSSFTANINEDDSFLEEETDTRVLDFPVTFSGEKLAGSGGVFAGKGTRTENIVAPLQVKRRIKTRERKAHKDFLVSWAERTVLYGGKEMSTKPKRTSQVFFSVLWNIRSRRDSENGNLEL
nr:hypothetical protein Iba_chr04cCG6080 [Ipomoea batatas]GME20290.1 hypothetical protein Iba_scaffold24762CG0020 [Ipomoea batatas]